VTTETVYNLDDRRHDMGRFIRRRVKDIRTIPPDLPAFRAVGNPRRELGITEKQERFARYVAGGSMTYTEAAAKAGFTKKWSHIYGPKLMNPRYFPKVVERVRQMKEQLAIRTDLTFDGHVTKMAEIRDAAMEKGNFTAAVAAEKSRGQAAGFYVSRSEIMVGKIDQMSREEVLAEIRRLQSEFPTLAGMPAGPVIDVIPNNEVIDVEIDTTDNRSENVAVFAGEDQDGGSMDEA
jgi:hypothetical protein